MSKFLDWLRTALSTSIKGRAPSPFPAPNFTENAFDKALKYVLSREGGYTDDPQDPGGPTYKGITLGDLAAWRRVPLTDNSRAMLVNQLKSLTEDEITEIYKSMYWDRAACEQLPGGLNLMHFDAAVNQGVTGANRMLQEAVGARVDGIFGPETKAKAEDCDVRATLARYRDLREARYKRTSTFARFGRGWLNRLAATYKLALSWTSVDPIHPVVKRIGTDTPEWVTRAIGFIGTKEISGSKHNDVIVKLWETAKIPMPVYDDETPWCATFVGAMLEASGVAGDRSAWARDYLKWGVKLEKPVVGCVAVFSRSGGGGHVGFVVGKDADGNLMILGGNQSDAVNISPKSTTRLLGYRWPSNVPVPEAGDLPVLRHGAVKIDDSEE